MGSPERMLLRSRLTEGLVLCAILAAFWLARWPYRDMFLIRDEGEYAYIGQRILAGDIPYRDVYNQKTPFAFYAFAAAQATLGPALSDLHRFCTGYGLLTIGAVYALARSAAGPLGAAVAAASLAAILFDQAGIVHQASTEYFMLLWLALGVLAWKKAADSAAPGWAAAAGALAGLACQTKQSGMALLLFFALDALWRRRSQGRAALGPAARELAWALAGFAALFAAVAAFFAAQGSLGAYVECAWLHIGGYVGERYRESQLADRLLETGRIIGWDAGFWAVGAFGLALSARRTGGAPSGWWILGLAFVAAAIFPGMPYRHYFLPLALPLVLGLAMLAQECLGPGTRVRRAAFGLALLLPWLGPLANGLSLLRIGEDAPPVFVRFLRPLDRAGVVADAIAARTEPGEPILIVGSEPQIYYLANRPAATRLIHLYTTTGPYSFAPSLRLEFVRDLREKRPRWVLLVNVASSLTEFPERLGSFLPPILQTLRADYVVEQRWDGPGTDMVMGGYGRAEFLLWRLRKEGG